MDHAGITEIVLDRGPCFGTCPVFRIVFSRSGSYRYEGSLYVEPLGEWCGAFPGHLFDLLAELCGELGILGLDEVYPSDLEDTPRTTISVRHRGGVKVIRDEGGNSAPARLWAFALLVEYALREVFEVEDRDRGKGYTAAGKTFRSR